MGPVMPKNEREFRQVASINPYALNPDGSLKSFLEQYGETEMSRLADKNYRAPGPYVLAFDGAFTGIPQMAGKPIVFSGRSLRHVLKKHGADASIFNDLVAEIKGNVLAYENPESAQKITFILDAKSSQGHDVITVLRVDLNMSQINVSAIRSVHGREKDLLMGSLNEALKLGRNVYLNEKSGAWLEIQKHIPDLSGVAKEVLKRLAVLYVTSQARSREAAIFDSRLARTGSWTESSPEKPGETISHEDKAAAAPSKSVPAPRPSKAAPAPKARQAPSPAADARSAAVQAQARSSIRQAPNQGKVR